MSPRHNPRQWPESYRGTPAFLVGGGLGYLGGSRRVRRALQYTTPANSESRRTTPPMSNACARGPANSGVPLVILSAALVVAVSKKLLRLLSGALWASRSHSSPHHASVTRARAATGPGSYIRGSGSAALHAAKVSGKSPQEPRSPRRPISKPAAAPQMGGKAP